MNPTSTSSKLTTTMSLDEYGTLQVNAPNESVPVTINDIGVFQAMSLMIQCMQTPCPPQHYRTGCEELLSAGNCTRCPLCPANKYRSHCNGASKGICLNVTTCGRGKVEVQGPTPTSDRVCAIPPCSVNEFEPLPITTSTSRQCTILSECNMTEFEAHAPTATTDRHCTGMTICNVIEFEAHAPTPTTNRLCADVTTCTAAEFEVYAPTATTDRQCMPCSTTTNSVLNCADVSSRAAITSNNICEVARVYNCCCDEFSSLTRVNGDVNVHSNETMLHFGKIWEVDGNIKGRGSSSSNRRPLQVVDFGQVTRVGGNVELRMNQITRVEFGALARVDGWLRLQFNDLTSIDFGAITHIGDHLYLYNNALTSIDFGAITHIGGRLRLFGNDLNSINFGAVTHIGSFVRVHNNPSLNSIDCRNLGSCLCRSSYTTPINCPSRCTFLGATCA
eukprot:gene4015-biopygen5106